MTNGEIVYTRVSGDGLVGLGLDALRGTAPKCLSRRHWTIFPSRLTFLLSFVDCSNDTSVLYYNLSYSYE